jgi:hypoxanthine phosphoribosyltransferase
MGTVDPFQYLNQAEQLYSEAEIAAAILGITEQLNQEYLAEQPIILCVMNGGLFFTGQLLPKLTFPFELDYVHATRYHGKTSGKKVKWIVKPKVSIKGRSILILDDILDEGVTLRSIVDFCSLFGAKQVKVAVLVEKIINKSKPISADYVGVTVPNRYVFGCGMDVYGWWRNVPVIYALNNNVDCKI